jgi:polyribonucleotide nucleotidyltransferase
VKEALKRIELILDPPKAEIGATYRGKVVNITKFGAFVNILPGRDGLVHISKLSKLAQGKRVERVEDVLSLGEELDVHVDDIDPIGKVSLSIEDGSGTSTPGTGPSFARRSERCGRRRRQRPQDGVVRRHLGARGPFDLWRPWPISRVP